MAHEQQKQFTQLVVDTFPSFFANKRVLDVGSLDINGNNRFMFTDCEYTGLDVGEGKNVDVVCPIHLYNPAEQYDVIVSTEMFEHNMYWRESLVKIIELLKDGGMFVFTCATTGRAEHGTNRTSKECAPLLDGSWGDYYMNLTEEHIREVLDCDAIFSNYEFSIGEEMNDLYFFGIKK
jgi:SAM-dependent methyltransferase